MCGVLSACGANDPEIAEYIERPVEQIYNEAFDELERGNFINAALQFDEVERQHPYSIWARRAMVMAAYTYYLQNKYELWRNYFYIQKNKCLSYKDIPSISM